MKKLSVLVTGIFLVLVLGQYSYAQIQIRNVDRVKYADIGYTQLGFGEVNIELLTKRQAKKISQDIEGLRKRFGVVVVFSSVIPEEAEHLKANGYQTYIDHYLGLDPRAARNHVGIQFEEINGRNQIQFGSDNAPYLDSEKEELSRQFLQYYRAEDAFPSMKRTLKSIKRIYRNLDDTVKDALHYPELSAEELVELGVAKMDWLSDLESAVGDFTQAAALNPSYARAYTRLGYAYIELENEHAAKKAFQRAWSLKPSFNTALGFLTHHYRSGNSEAVRFWKGELIRFESDYAGKIKSVALYGGFFITESARTVFSIMFEKEISTFKSNADRAAQVKAGGGG